MAFVVKNLVDNDDVSLAASVGCFDIIERPRTQADNTHGGQCDASNSQLHKRRRQVIAKLHDSAVILQSGVMQWTVGNVALLEGPKDDAAPPTRKLRKAVMSEVTEKSVYAGTGLVALEPTFDYLVTLNPADWNGSVILDDKAFIACEASVRQRTVPSSDVISAVASGKGLFNVVLSGAGAVIAESAVPSSHLVEVELDNDVLRVDASLAIAWSASLQFTVERASKRLLSSVGSGAGLMNVYTGTGRVLMAPFSA